MFETETLTWLSNSPWPAYKCFILFRECLYTLFQLIFLFQQFAADDPPIQHLLSYYVRANPGD